MNDTRQERGDSFPGEFPELADENRRIWNANARWWDDRIGDRNKFQERLIEPGTERLLRVAAGDIILDVACGAGRFARRIASLDEIRFTKAVCTMALMDMPEIAPLFRALARQLPIDGTLVFSVAHPCFHSAAVGPLATLLRAGFDAGFVLDGLEEPIFQETGIPTPGVRWTDMPDVPPVLIARLKLVSKSG